MIADDEPRRQAAQHLIGCDLSTISADELRQRIAAMEAEITRLRAEIDRKEAGRKAADSLFGPKV